VILLVPAVAALATGLFLGWVLKASCEAAAASRFQERMRNKIMQLEQQLEARGTRPESPWKQWWS
jgi:type VI protein secretion system component VasF